MRAAAREEQALAHLVHGLFLLVGLREVEAQAFGGRGHVGGERRHVGHFTLAERRLHDLGGVEALQGLHAGDQARFQVLHAAGVLEVSRQLHEDARDDPGTLAQIALFKRSVFRPPFFLPELLALHFEQFSGVAVLQHLAVLGDAVECGIALGLHSACGEQTTQRQSGAASSEFHEVSPSLYSARSR